MAISYKIKGTDITEHFSWEEYSINQKGTVYVKDVSLLQAQCLEEFRAWLGKSMKVNAWYRTPSYNKSVGGVANSSHLEGKATDISFPNISKSTFIKYAKKWFAICNAHGVVAECGRYKWGMHLGSSVTYSNKNYHWDSTSGKQINMPYEELKN